MMAGVVGFGSSLSGRGDDFGGCCASAALAANTSAVGTSVRMSFMSVWLESGRGRTGTPVRWIVRKVCAVTVLRSPSLTIRAGVAWLRG